MSSSSELVCTFVTKKKSVNQIIIKKPVNTLIAAILMKHGPRHHTVPTPTPRKSPRKRKPQLPLTPGSMSAAISLASMLNGPNKSRGKKPKIGGTRRRDNKLKK
jgi:hypothetical protein